MFKNNQNRAKEGEDLATAYLIKKGYRILKRNFHSRFGEIDIIATDKNTLIFIEVKSRWSESFGSPEEAVTIWKLQSIIKTANYFKMCNPQTPSSQRIDAIGIVFADNGKAKINHLENITG